MTILPAPPRPLMGRDRYTIRLHNRRGGLRPWWATVIDGVVHVGESGSSVYSSRTERACIRKAMRTVSRIASERGRSFHVVIEEAE